MENIDLTNQPVGLIDMANERISQLDETIRSRDIEINELKQSLTAVENKREVIRSAYVAALQDKDDLQKAFNEEKESLITAHNTELEALKAENQSLNGTISSLENKILDAKTRTLNIAEELRNYLLQL